MLNLILLPFVIIIGAVVAIVYGIAIYVKLFKVIFKEFFIKKEKNKILSM